MIFGMNDFSAARRTMVDNQIRTYDVTDRAVLASFESVPREAFVASGQAGVAYLDRELPACTGARLVAPMVLARLIQALEVSPGNRVLDVNGSGYGAAILSGLGASVVSLDADSVPAAAALAAVGVDGVATVSGSLAGGAAAKGPYDVILVHGAADVEPTALFGQLKDGGRLGIVMGRGRTGRATVFRKSRSTVSGFAIFDAAAPSLPEFAAKPAFQF